MPPCSPAARPATRLPLIEPMWRATRDALGPGGASPHSRRDRTVLIHERGRAAGLRRVITRPGGAGRPRRPAPALPCHRTRSWRRGRHRDRHRNPRRPWRAQTPQGFRLGRSAPPTPPIRAAPRTMWRSRAPMASPWRSTQGDEANLKLTTEADFTRALRLMETDMDIPHRQRSSAPLRRRRPM